MPFELLTFDQRDRSDQRRRAAGVGVAFIILALLFATAHWVKAGLNKAENAA